MASKIRKEVHLDKEAVVCLKIGAEKKGWSLKKFMEAILLREAIRQSTKSR